MPAQSAGGEDELTGGLKSFTSVYRLVEENFADKVNPDKAIYKGAIPGMLRTLDPHSSFFDPRDFQLLREDQRGAYFGVGMQVGPNATGKTIVIAPFTGSPAYKAGIRPGDMILEVNDKRSDGLTTTEVADLLEGAQGHPGPDRESPAKAPKSRSSSILSATKSPASASQNAFFLKPGIAYIDIECFNENTSQELEKTISSSSASKTLKGLILDLRENPGGLLNEGVAVAGRFLKPGQTGGFASRPLLAGKAVRAPTTAPTSGTIRSS